MEYYPISNLSCRIPLYSIHTMMSPFWSLVVSFWYCSFQVTTCTEPGKWYKFFYLHHLNKLIKKTTSNWINLELFRNLHCWLWFSFRHSFCIPCFLFQNSAKWLLLLLYSPTWVTSSPNSAQNIASICKTQIIVLRFLTASDKLVWEAVKTLQS